MREVFDRLNGKVSCESLMWCFVLDRSDNLG